MSVGDRGQFRAHLHPAGETTVSTCLYLPVSGLLGPEVGSRRRRPWDGVTQLPAEWHSAFPFLGDDSAWLPLAGPAGSGHPPEWTG